MSASSFAPAAASPTLPLFPDHAEALVVGQDRVIDGNVVVLPTEATTEQDLLAGLLAFTQSTACASALLHHFPSIGHVITAEPSQLRGFGVSGREISILRLVREIACRMAKAEVRRRPVLGNWQALIDYLQTAMAYEQIEQFRILFLDRKNNLIADEVQQRGTVDHTPVYPREVVKRALILNASALIAVHYVARHIMRIMCPAPLCGQSQRSRRFLSSSARAGYITVASAPSVVAAPRPDG
jgi:DNA repair protein RadC